MLKQENKKALSVSHLLKASERKIARRKIVITNFLIKVEKKREETERTME